MSSWLEKFCTIVSNEQSSEEETSSKCNYPLENVDQGIYKEFSSIYDQIIKESSKTNICLSTNHVSNLESFDSFIKGKTFNDNKEEIIKILIVKMLEGDDTANSIYGEIYSEKGMNDLLLDSVQIINDQHLLDIQNSVEEGSYIAITQAVHWLESEEAGHVSPELVDWYHDCCSFDMDSGG